MKKGFLIFYFALFSITSKAQVDVFTNINSPADEMNPVLTEGGNTLYFVRVFDEQNTGGMRDPGDIWTSSMTDSAVWSSPVKLSPPLNSAQFNGVIGFSPKGDKAYLYEHYMPGGKPARTQGLSTSLKMNGVWTDPVRLDIKYFYNKSEHISVSVSDDGSIMLLALESYGTHGAEDIYVSFRDGNEWSEPRNLGSRINTKLQEMTPYLAPDNRTLFFASNGHEGYGGRDIFVSSRQDDSWRNWSEPKNLGPKVNTEGVELYFQYFPGEEKAIFTSTQNSDGYSDMKVAFFPKSELEEIMEDTIAITEPVVSITMNEEQVNEVSEESLTPELMISGVITNVENGEGITATLLVQSANWRQEISSDPGDGYELTIPAQDVYQVTVQAEGFVSIQENLDVRTTELVSVAHDFEMQPIAVGTTVKLNNVLFVRGSTELLESSSGELDLVVKMMQENPEMEISLAGHTDNQGNARLNKVLSQQRVDAVIYYLNTHGISSDRLSGNGYGGSQPIASNESEETRRLNRRVEFTIEKF
ncbi:MAG: OmpA family protein [Saprospiraceae bacterium]|nr:OmpA family protein [Saprospiraceae bacterium]